MVAGAESNFGDKWLILGKLFSIGSSVYPKIYPNKRIFTPSLPIVVCRIVPAFPSVLQSVRKQSQDALYSR